ncbi:MAG: glycosyltransferase family 9 protein [Gammaproteobacteria bacterium]|nr:glycosyltransferase family 9 protein [Gammaproteobacteria bacterium]
MLERGSTNRTRVLVIRAGQLGDTVCAASIINPLLAHFGENTVIDWVAKAGIGNIFAKDSRINRVFQMKTRKTPFIINPVKQQIIFSSLLNPYDYIINLELGSMFNDVMRLTRAKHKIGMPYRHFTEPAETHAVENLHLVYRSFLNEEDMKFAQPSLIGTDIPALRSKFNLPESYIVLVPSNSHHNKKSSINLRAWPVTHWNAFFKLIEKNNVNAIMIGSDSEKAFFNQLMPLPDSIKSLVGKTSFSELVGLIAGAKNVVVTDTGPAHIAAAVDTPVIALIGPTNFKRTGPYQTKTNKITIVKSNIECSPCYHTEKMQTCRDNKCMSEISPQVVMDYVLSSYSENNV